MAVISRPIQSEPIFTVPRMVTTAPARPLVTAPAPVAPVPASPYATPDVLSPFTPPAATTPKLLTGVVNPASGAPNGATFQLTPAPVKSVAAVARPVDAGGGWAPPSFGAPPSVTVPLAPGATPAPSTLAPPSLALAPTIGIGAPPARPPPGAVVNIKGTALEVAKSPITALAVAAVAVWFFFFRK